MADAPPRLLPDPLLRIQRRRIGWKRDKIKTSDLSEVGADEPSFMPGSSIPEYGDSFPGIRAPQVSQMTKGCMLILPLAPHGMLFARTQVERAVETDLVLSRICLDMDIFPFGLPDG